MDSKVLEKLLLKAKGEGNEDLAATYQLQQGKNSYNRGEFLLAIRQLLQALDKLNEFGATSEILEGYQYVGRSFERLGRLSEALKYWHLALEIAKRADDHQYIGRLLSSIATVYTKLNEFPEAISYEQQSMQYNNAINDMYNVAISLNNIASNYNEMGQPQQALSFLHRSIEINEGINSRDNLLYNYATLGEVYSALGKLDSAEFYGNKALEIAYELDDPYEISYSYHDLGNIDLLQEQPREAITAFRKSFQIGEGIKAKELVENASYGLSKAFAKLNQNDSAYAYLKDYYLAKREFWVEEVKNVEQLNAFYLKEQQKAIVQRLEMEKAVAETKVLKQDVMNKAIAGLVLVLFLVGAVVYRNYEQKTITSKMLEQQNDRIQESLNYALSIQQAMLPSAEELNKVLIDYFILDKPRDVVSGDFYWCYEKNGYKILVVADCTGHGVPGAFMSVLGMEKLGEIVEMEDAVTPGAILRRLHEGITSSLRQDKTRNNDGMDIAITVLTPENKILFAGAKNPLIVLDHTDLDQPELMVHKGSRQPIGGTFSKETPNYQSDIIEVDPQRNYTFYMFSDGYQDQFGGPRKKKFMIKRFKELLTQNARLNLEDQKDLLEENFKQWKGLEDQVDDVLVVGFRLF
jgi:serine phosphatase RsbU (regulator of sigma subunit)